MLYYHHTQIIKINYFILTCCSSGNLARVKNMKVALITGSARRIGGAIASALHHAGWNIVLHYFRQQDKAQQLCTIFNTQRNNSAIALHEDLRNIHKLKHLVLAAAEMWGRLDLLVNNASCFQKTTIGRVNESIWDEIMRTNLQAPFFLAQYAAPWLAKTCGSIINITDTHVHHPLRDYGIYCMSKAGLTSMTRVLAKELGPEIRVNAIAPGLIAWPEGENMVDLSLQEKLVATTSLKRAGKPDDIANAVLFFAHEDSYISGQILSIDGGRML